ncbi:VOC family protein [Micromonospora sp. NBC_01699]|uniref:VOC family protein n=1 Tax=Micromonospora sp. NBC_01699 TaxID=2975984 RepID=UPI002E295D66|nr:VOC family protein [Micromonospora sp. NBC_01699]
MILRIDHVGMVAANLKAAAAGLRMLTMSPDEHDIVATYDVECQFWRREGDPTAIEIVTPAGPSSQVSGHLRRSGPGLHHVAFEVDDIVAELAVLRARGAVLVDDEPRPGGQPGLRIAFVHLGPATGLLVELVQYAEPRVRPVAEVPRQREAVGG